MNIAKPIAEAIKRKKLTREQFAEEAGISIGALYRLLDESLDTEPTLPVLRGLRNAGVRLPADILSA